MIAGLWSDDIFISYSHWDASTYAPGLANALIEKGYKPFYDRYGSRPGRELPEELKREIRRSRMFVLLATACSARSESIQLEIEEFKKTGRESRIVPVDVDGSLRGARWYHLVDGVAPEVEKNPNALDDGKPSPSVISRIDESFKYVKGKTKLRLATAVTGVLLAGLLVASAWATTSAYKNLQAAEAAAQEASKQTRIAGVATQEAEVATREAKLAEEARANADTARGKAVEAQGKAEEAQREAEEAQAKAEEARKEAVRQQEIAEKRRAEAEKLRDEAEAEAQKRRAEAASIQFANKSITSVEDDPVRGLVQAIKAGEHADTQEARNALGLAIQKSRLTVIDWAEGVWKSPAWLSAEFSSDGQKIVSVSGKGTANVVDAASGRTLATMRTAIGDLTYGNFNKSGQKVVTADFDGVLRVWDAATGAKLKILRPPAAQTPDAPPAEVKGADGASGPEQKAAPDAEAEEPSGPQPEPALFASFVGDTDKVVSYSQHPKKYDEIKGVLRAWDAGTGKLAYEIRDISMLPAHVLLYNLLGFSPSLLPPVNASFSDDRRKAIFVQSDGKGGTVARVVNTETGEELTRFKYGTRKPEPKPTPEPNQPAAPGDEGAGCAQAAEQRFEPVYAAISGDASSAVTFERACNGAAVVIWDLKTSRPRMVIDSAFGLKGEIIYPVLSRDGHGLLTCNEQGTVQSWLLTEDAEGPVTTWVGHRKKPLSKAPNSMDAFDEEVSGVITYAAFSPGGDYVLSMAGDETVRVTEFPLGREVFSFRNPTFSNPEIGGLDDVVGINYAAFSPDGSRLVTASSDGGARIYDLTKRNVPDEFASLTGMARAKLPVTLTAEELHLIMKERMWGPPSYVRDLPRETKQDVEKKLISRKGQEGCCSVTPETSALLDALKAVLDKELGIDSSVFKCENRLILDYGADEAGFDRLSTRLEERFTIDASDYEHEDILTPCDIYRLLVRKGAKPRP